VASRNSRRTSRKRAVCGYSISIWFDKKLGVSFSVLFVDESVWIRFRIGWCDGGILEDNVRDGCSLIRRWHSLSLSLVSKRCKAICCKTIATIFALSLLIHWSRVWK
jgi:hypothetical protein